MTSKENNLYDYKNYLKIIIGGLGLQIFFLIHGNALGAHVTNVLGGKYALSFNLNSLMYGNVVFAMRIFICIFAICFFFEMLTSAKYEETIDYAFPLMILINIFGLW